jgi:hypothetical protein
MFDAYRISRMRIELFSSVISKHILFASCGRESGSTITHVEMKSSQLSGFPASPVYSKMEPKVFSNFVRVQKIGTMMSSLLQLNVAQNIK